MLGALIPAIISALTSILSVILPLIAANTGRSALQKDIDLYKQWRDVMAPCVDVPANQGLTSSSSLTTDVASDTQAGRLNNECDQLTMVALTKFRHHIDLRLIVRSRNHDISYPLYVTILISLFLCYVISQVVLRSEGFIDDLVRSFIYLALVLVVIGIFGLTVIHKVKKADAEWDAYESRCQSAHRKDEKVKDSDPE